MAKALFAEGKDVVILVADGTYEYMYNIQKYNIQKQYRVVTILSKRVLFYAQKQIFDQAYDDSATRHILDVFGPYFAGGKSNDILNNISNSQYIKQSDEREKFSTFRMIWPKDIMVVDRGFRDSITTLEEYGLISKMNFF